MKKSLLKLGLLIGSIFSLASHLAIGQISVTTTNTFLNNNGSGTVTFNLQNTNNFPIIIQEFHGVIGTTATVPVEIYFNNTPLSGAPAAFTTTNGWNLVASGTVAAVTNTTTTITQPFLTGLNLIVPANTTLGVAVFATSQRYFTHPGPVTTDSAAGVRIITGTNIGYGGNTPPTAPTISPRGWIGTIRFIPAIPCSGTPVSGNATSNRAVACSAQSFLLSLANDSIRQNLGYQWLTSTSGLPGTYTPIPNDTLRTVTETQTISRFYRCVVNCGTSRDTSTEVFVNTPVGALSGTFTINPTLPLSATNYYSLRDLATTLSCVGVSGPVTINFAPGIGTLNENVAFGIIAGASATNTITINGNGNTISAGSSPIVTFAGTRFVTWDSLNIVGAGSFAGFGVHLSGNSQFITISRSTIDVGLTSSATSNAGIVASGNTATATTAGSNAQNISILNNRIIGGYYGICLVGNTGYLNNTGHIIANNSLTNFHLYGIYLANSDTVSILNNDLSRLNRPTFTTFYGIYGTTTRNTQVIGNKIRDSGPGSYVAYPIWFATSVNNVGFETRIINNAIFNITTTGTYYGIYLSTSASNFIIAHNTIHDNATGTTAVRRNLWIGAAPTNVAVRNNIFSSTAAGTGAKHLVYITTTSATYTSNNNVYFMGASGGTNSLGFWTADRTNLAAWRTATSQDAASVSSDPVYFDLSAGSLEPASSNIDNVGLPIVGVSTDILGRTRNLTTPDAGAYEFVGINADVQLSAANLILANCNSANDTLKVKLKNRIGSTIDFATQPLSIRYTITGPINRIDSLVLNSDSLPAGQEIEYTVATNINRSIAGTYQALVFIPIGPGNDNAGNDTIRFAVRPPLNGNYNITIGSANFPTLQSVFDTLSLRGVCGAVNITLNNNNAIFNESVQIRAIPGSSEIRTITIKGRNNTLQNTASPILRFNGAANMIIDSLNIIAPANYAGFGIHFGNASKQIVYQNSTINVGTTSTSTTNAAIVASGSTTTATTAGNNAQQISLLNNVIIGGYYGIVLTGEASYLNNSGHIIRNNVVRDFHLYGIYTANANNITIDSNDLHRLGKTTLTTFYGYYGTTSRNIRLTKNRIHDAGVGTYTAYPIYMPTSLNLAGEETQIINNAIYNINTTGLIYGFYFATTTDGFRIYHNTIDINGAGTGAKRGAFFAASPLNTEFRNNIISVSGIASGSGAKHCIYVTTPSLTFGSNHNVLYMGGIGGTINNVGFWGAETPTLANWQSASLKDSASSASNPVFNNLNAGDFRPTSSNIDNMAAYVGVNFDINGSPKAVGTPDVGALEFTGVSADLGITDARLIRSSQCYSMFDTTAIIIRNVIGANIDFSTSPTTVVYQITGPVNTTDSIIINAGTLAPNAFFTAKVSTTNLSIPGTYTLRAHLRPNGVNSLTNNDTLGTPFTLEVRPILSVSPKTATANSNQDTFILRAQSPLFPVGGTFFSEICHWRLATGAAPLGGWPAYMLADDYVEITGLPNSSLAGFVMEEWIGTALQHTVTFPSGTVFSPGGTMIIATGQLNASVPSPANFYYHSGHTVIHNSTDVRGYILKNSFGTIVDATVTGAYTFPATSGVTASDWTGSTPAVSSAGNKLIGPDNNTGSNWVTAAGAFLQNPNAINPGVPAPMPGSMAGFNWYYLNTPIDTNASIKVGPYTTPGLYRYVAEYNTACGIFRDTVTITASSTVPVSINYFNAAKAENDVVLNWQTASEINNAYFEVERSADNSRFEPIGRVKGKGNSVRINNYSFKDEEAILHFSNLNQLYYRLKQVDKDGTYEYSQTAVINLSTSNNLQAVLFPNPNNGSFTIHLDGVEEGNNIELSIVDMMGNLMYASTYNNNHIAIDAPFAPGVYTALIKVGDIQKSVRISVTE
jgi:hypothetical protein